MIMGVRVFFVFLRFFGRQKHKKLQEQLQAAMQLSLEASMPSVPEEFGEIYFCFGGQRHLLEVGGTPLKTNEFSPEI